MGEYFFERNALTFKSSLTFPIDFNLPSAGTAARHAADFASEWPERALALMMALALSPLMLLTALLVKMNSRGPAIYSQVRVGKDGKNFSILKFRSMVMNAEAKTGPVLSNRADTRVTAVG